MIDRVDEELCDGCGICIETCPCDVLATDLSSGRATVAHLDDCQTCFLCELDCPRGAITVGPLRKARVQAWPAGFS